MRVVIAPDSFKESLVAADVARHIEEGFRAVFPDWDYVKVPMADGGEGTVRALVAATNGRIVSRTVRGPLDKPVVAQFGLTGSGDTAVIEMAAACGLALLAPEDRDPMLTSTLGVGELIRAALDLGARHLIIGIGGSATNDGGTGMAQALGVRMLDGSGMDIGRGGGALAHLDRIDVSGIDPRLAQCTIDVACDVDNPLFGPSGASAVFGPQKGATADSIRQLDDNLRHFAGRIEAGMGIAVGQIPGSGAAGGLGAGMVAFLGARLRPGVEIVVTAVGLEALIADADLIITGEGRIDSQTVRGKAPSGVARIARRHNKPVIAIAGSLGDGADLVHATGIDAMFSVISKPCTVSEALAEAAANVRAAARNVAVALRIGGQIQTWDSPRFQAAMAPEEMPAPNSATHSA